MCIRWRRASDCSSWNWAASWRNPLIWKKDYYRMSFSIVPSNLGDTVKETDKDINNTKSSILPMQMTPNKKYVNEKTETIHFLSKYVGRSLFVETFIKRQHAGITQTTTQTVMYIIKTNLCHFFRSIRIEQPCNTKQTNSRRPRISSSKKQWKTLFLSHWRQSLRSPFQVFLFSSAWSFCFCACCFESK